MEARHLLTLPAQHPFVDSPAATTVPYDRGRLPCKVFLTCSETKQVLLSFSVDKTVIFKDFK